MYRLLSILIFLPFLSIGQSSFADDSILQRLSDSLPTGWTMTLKGDMLTISAKDSIWERDHCKINEPMPKDPRPPTEEEIKQVFMDKGRKVMRRLTYRLVPKWSTAQIDSAETRDSLIHDQIKKLAEKYNVKTCQGFDGPYCTYVIHSKEEGKRIAKFQEGCKEMLSTLVKVPRFYSQKYSLFEVSATGFTTWFIDVWPQKAEEYCNNVVQEIDDILYMRRAWIYDGKY